MRLKYFYIIVFLIWLCIFIALLPAHKISAILEAIDFRDKNLTQREIVELNLKDYLKKLHYLDNYPRTDFGKMADIHLDENGYERVRFSWCNGDKYPDDRCEFWKLDKRLNFDYLMDLGSKICKDGEPIRNAEEIVENDEVLKLRLFYPWEQEHLIDEDGNFIENFIYTGFGLGAPYPDGLFKVFEGFLFVNKDNFELPIYPETKNKKFDIIRPINDCYYSLLYSFVESQIDNSISLNSFCDIHERFALKKQLWKDEPIDCDREYTFSFIPVYSKIPKLTKDAIFKDHNYHHKPDIDILFNQYQNLKNQKNKINFNSQGEDNGTESK